VTPAEMAEQLIKHEEDPDLALEAFLDFLKFKKVEDEEAKAKKDKEEEEANYDENHKNDIQGTVSMHGVKLIRVFQE